MEAGLEEGELRPEADPIAASMLAATLRGLMVDRARSEAPAPAEPTAERVVDLFLRGAGADT